MNTRYATTLVVAAALLLSGLSLVSSYQPAIAQVEMTGEAAGGGAAATDNTTTTMGGAAEGGNATDAAGANQSEVRLHIEEALAALQNNDTQGAMMHLDLAFGALGGNSTTTAGFEVEDEDQGGVEAGDEVEGGVEVEDEDTGEVEAGDEVEGGVEVEDEDTGEVEAGGVGAG